MITAAFIATFVPLMLLAMVLRHSRAVMLSFCWGMGAFMITHFLVPVLEPYFDIELPESAVFLGPPVEEVLKALPLFFFLFFAPKTLVPFFYILGMASGIGFAVEENLKLLLQMPPSEQTIWLMVARSFSTCLMHGQCTILVGLAMTTCRRRKGFSCLLPFLALAAASLLHALFNYAALTDRVILYLTIPFLAFLIGARVLKRIHQNAPETQGTDWE